VGTSAYISPNLNGESVLKIPLAPHFSAVIEIDDLLINRFNGFSRVNR